MIFILNDYLVLKVLKITEKYKIEDESNVYFQVVVVTPQGAELVLIREQLEAFIADRKDYTFLIPAGQELKIQEEARASYRQRYTGDSYPSLKVERLDAEHQLIELYMSGDPRDITLWYEATDKKFVPKYELMISAMMLGCVDILTEPNERAGKINKAQVITSQFIKARKDAAEMLEFVDIAFDQMTFAVDMLVVVALDFAIGARRNDRRGSLRRNEINKSIRIVPFISNDKCARKIFD